MNSDRANTPHVVTESEASSTPHTRESNSGVAEITTNVVKTSEDVAVLNVSDVDRDELQNLVNRFNATLEMIDKGQDIRGSYWGEREAGLVGSQLYVRADTPVHSALHELCHFICMSPQTRAVLDTNAGGDYDEENGVCYLQIILADELTGVGRSRLMHDMDAWGYTFRLGSTQAWFEHDACDAQSWLRRYGLIDSLDRATWTVRQTH